MPFYNKRKFFTFTIILFYLIFSGFLYIFSTFNRRRWGKRWCLVKGNMFECYRSKTSPMCELNFLLRSCVIRHAMDETNSPLAIMLLEDNTEKITVEVCTKSSMQFCIFSANTSDIWNYKTLLSMFELTSMCELFVYCAIFYFIYIKSV